MSLDGGKGDADLLGLDNADGLAIHKEQVVSAARDERNFSNGDSLSCPEVELPGVLHHPATGNKECIDLLAGGFFEWHRLNITLPRMG